MSFPPSSEVSTQNFSGGSKTAVCWLAVILSTVIGFLPPQASAEEVNWHDAKSFEIEGRGWEKTAPPYGRLPDSAKNRVKWLAWDLSNNNPGVCIRFLTDASVIKVRWSLLNGNLAMPHMAATGVSGVDLYARSDDGSWVFVGNGRPHKQDENIGKFEFPGREKRERECLLYLPAYNGIKSLRIGVPPGANVRKPGQRPEAFRKPVVVYGTSIAQGACASRQFLPQRKKNWDRKRLWRIQPRSGAGKPQRAVVVLLQPPGQFGIEKHIKQSRHHHDSAAG